MKKLYLLVITSVLSVGVLFGQSQLKKADKLFEEFKFVKALDQYMAAYEKEQSEVAITGIVESYKRMGALSEAESYLQQLVNMPSSRPVYKLYLGQSLLSNGKYDEAAAAFQTYADLVPSDSRGKSFLTLADNYAQLNVSDPESVVEALEMNSPYDDYSPCFFKDGIIFSSDRGGIAANKIYDVTGRPFTDLYFSPSDGDLKHTLSDLWGSNINTDYHEGTCAFSSDGNKVYFTRDNYFKRRLVPSSDNIVKLKIYAASRESEEDKWEIDEDEIPFNNDDYSVMHPSLSDDGNALYFASDMPGGYGETDVYVVYRVGSSWGEPENLGPEVNSEGRDQFPFIANDGTLYYASDGIAGLGGLDIFKSRLIDGNWAASKNLGAPVNSNSDDFGLIIETDSRSGYFTSRRPGGSGLDDIYSFRKSECITLSGAVVDGTSGEAIANARVVVKDEDGSVIFEDDADESGMFTICLDAENNYSVTANHENYNAGTTENLSTYGMTEKTASLQIALANEAEEEVATDENNTDTLNDTGEAPAESTDATGDATTSGACVVSGRVFENATGNGLQGSKVTLQAVSGGAQETYTDASGNYSFTINADTDYKIYSNTTNYFTGSAEFKTATGDCSRNIDLGLDLIEMNKAVTLEHIYYDLGSANIRQDAVPELEKLVTLMQENPGITVTLCSHTDSRGSDSANLDLSQRRAQAAVEYIVSRGIDTNRITPTGFGESQLLNECADGVSCTDAQHQQNRRTEFKITGYDSGILYSESRYFNSDSTTPVSDIYGTGTAPMFIDK